MKKSLTIVGVIWIILVVASFTLYYLNAKKEQERIAFQTARSFFNHVFTFRAWNAIHGGVYVPVTQETTPSPYLDDPLRDIEISKNLTLTKISPDMMIRQTAEIAGRQQGIHFHITSLNPIRPENRASPEEENALKAFDAGVLEFGRIIDDESGSTFFYMAPLKTEKTCLGCHARQGGIEGDIRGGISVTLPFVSRMQVMTLMAGHIGIALFGLIGIIVFGTKLNNAYELIKRQAVIDALTGIPNRRSFSDHILKEVNRSQRDKYPLSVIMGDIDNFKLYNDTYGHSGGDDCLRKVAKTIEDTLKRPSDFCARYGGEEFIIILPYTAHEGAMLIAEKIRTHVGNLQISHKKSLPSGVVTISLGVATSNVDASISHEELTKQADTALYVAKEKGRNCVQAYRELPEPSV